MTTILTPHAFNKQLTLTLITAVNSVRGRAKPGELYKQAQAEINALIYSLNKCNPVRKPVTQILRIEVINSETGYRVTVGQRDVSSEITLLITAKNKGLLESWYRYGHKPQDLMTWKRVFEGKAYGK